MWLIKNHYGYSGRRGEMRREFEVIEEDSGREGKRGLIE